VAGTGKSTIARTIANEYDKAGRLGASFFCSGCKTQLRVASSSSKGLIQMRSASETRCRAMASTVAKLHPQPPDRLLVGHPYKHISSRLNEVLRGNFGRVDGRILSYRKCRQRADPKQNTDPYGLL